MNVNDTVKRVHEMAKAKGWWDEERSPLEIHMLCVTELAEATESCRAGLPHLFFSGPKPEGESIELADVVIRIMDYFGKQGWDLEDAIEKKISYNSHRPHRHGGKKY